MSTPSTYRPQNNTPLLTRSFRSGSRQQRRRDGIRAVTVKMAQKFAGTGRNGGLQWTEGMCPRRLRRSIILDAFRRVMRGEMQL